MPVSRRSFLKSFGLASAALAVPYACVAPKRRNVLFIAVDDLRPLLGCYGDTTVKSPNIDKLAREGVFFEQAYCQQPICMASRASLLTGFRPDHNDIYNCTAVQDLVPDALTLNKHFQKSGYQIWASGKIYHHGIDRKMQFGDQHVDPPVKTTGRGYLDPGSVATVQEYAKKYEEIRGGESNGRGPAFEAPDVADKEYTDGASTDLAIDQLGRFAKSGESFFMAMGFHKPHLPFNAPKKYWDLYDPAEIDLADNPFLPKNSTRYTPYSFGELRNYAGIPKDNELFSDDLSRKLIHGYLACVSYTDALIGRLLDQLDRVGLKENTIIVLWGDHGWKLGEHGMWCKHTHFELDARVPLMFAGPDIKAADKPSPALAEFVDIYPTLCELAGVPLPDHLEGDSLVPVLQNPNREWKEAAFTQWPKSQRGNPDRVVMGYSVKTSHYRYTEWTRKKTGEILDRELYDHDRDPDENENIAGYPEHGELVQKLSTLLDGGKGWRKMRMQ